MTVVKINALEVPEGKGPELERRFAQRQGEVDQAPGFLGFELLRPVKGDNRYFVCTKWESEQDFRNWAEGPAKRAHAADSEEPVATGASLLEFELVTESHPER
ncbi:heme-degrading monooxygenase HmoA [Actinopolyspora biskrensis]|uniref:Heme-degrading monooxygenase HmoA n=1 Tax=Actinopolyspora biskrensis TaxID=1470178 RepID=A0A852Z129_9ACTN|nr:antibiotic biosynthesis monooxygenase [Actinopolyspora biskrensis]NYH78975.1 heme-degrading monooxygenase HmoA [Actinopolyspora biskrensis]